MKMNNKLAIVIPAYKQQFLRETLESIANQTCKNFTLYIGDDASPDDLYSIIRAFENEINISYKKFNENLGGKDLVAHWGRCIDLTQNEEWIWLFSDDDLMDLNCVEGFYESLNNNENVDLLHFNLRIIDQYGRSTKECNPYPEHLEVTDFFFRRINFKINSTGVEYIFRKSGYVEKGGFQNYDLAWCADDATWIKLGMRSGIGTIQGPKVSWRYSGSNISSNVSDKTVIRRKVNSIVSHMKWISTYFAKNALIDNTTQFQKLKWAISIIVITTAFSFKEKYNIVADIIKELGFTNIKSRVTAYLVFWEMKNRTRSFKN